MMFAACLAAYLVYCCAPDSFQRPLASAVGSSSSAAGMWIARLSQTVLNLSQLTVQTTPVDTNEEDGNRTDEEDDQSGDQPELFSIMDLDEENDIRTELNNHPSVKRLTKTLNQQALFRGVPITAPTQTTLGYIDVDTDDDSNRDSRGSSSKRPRAEDEEVEESTPRPTTTITTKRRRVRSLKFLNCMHH